MKQSSNLAKAANLRHFFIAVFFLISFNQAFASGSKLPEVANTTPTDNSGIASTTDFGPTQYDSSLYSHLDPNHEVPAALLKKAIDYFDSHKSIIKNKSTLGVIDFSQHNSKERLYLIDMVSGAVDRYLVAHGKNSDPNYTGYATIFSNTPGSEMSSQGFYLTAETYIGGHGLSLALDGLSPTNSNARSRAIVIHPADYVQPGG